MSRTFSLRAHKAPIACITTFENSIVSGDRDGYVIVWDVFRKRPLALWKAHHGQIISMQLTPLGLLTHGRDSSIRIWHPPFTGLHNDTSILSSGPNSPTLDFSSISSQKTPSSFEIPVNALNFCNVAYHNGLLATPATRDSENFDIYRVLEDFSLLRMVENYSCPKDLEEIASPDQRAGAGIIMRLLFVDDSLLFAGYESGRIVGFRFKNEVVSSVKTNERLLLNKGTKVTVVMDERAHTPHPVLSLEYEPSSGKLYTGSASKKLLVYSIGHLVRQNGEREDEVGEAEMNTLSMESHNLHHYGIQGLQIGGNNVVAGFWDGFVVILNKDFTLLTEFERNEESIQPEEEGEVGRTSKKSLCVHIWHPPEDNEVPTSKKALMRRQRNQTTSLLLVGYGDGLVSAYSLL